MDLAALHLTTHDTRTAPEEFLRALHQLDTGFEHETRPDEPTTPLEVALARTRSRPSYVDEVAVLAQDRGTAVGAVWLEIGRKETNAHVIEGFMVVDPAHRRRGAGRRLLAAANEIAESEGRTSQVWYTHGGVPAGAAFAERLGASLGLVERGSELDLLSLDRDLVDRWVAEGPDRAPGYELLTIEGDVPDDLVEPYATLYAITNTAPRDDLDVEDELRTPEQIRDSDRARREAGGERILTFARRADDGELAGWTELGLHPGQPWKVHQYWTAVHPDHRGHALGKWLKAVNIVRALERWPEGTKIVTGNAYSNDAMLGINNELGFKETEAWSAWQVSTDRIREYLVSAAD